MKKNLSICTIFFSFLLMQASYQHEHYTDFDEDAVRCLFMQENSVLNQFGTDFFKDLPFQPLLQGLLCGVHPYQLLLIDQDSVSPYVLIKSTASYAYIVGKPNRQQLDTIMEKLAIYPSLILLCDESLQTYFVQHGFVIQPRIEFDYSEHYQLLHKDIPVGFTVERLDLSLFKQSAWYGFLSSVLGGSKRFLEIGFGFALVNEQGISVAQAYGAMLGHGLCEIGVVTHPDYRGKGYIIYPAIAVMEECFQRDLTPVWSCNSENIASLKTALKLGFEIKRHYAFLKKF